MVDHLVYLVEDLGAAVARLAQLGLPCSPGGRHPSRGTHNALLRLGPRTYLELLAPDPRATVAPPRWMGIDRGELPRLGRWAIGAGADIAELANRLAPPPPVRPGRRQLADGTELRWRLTDPGSDPAVAVVPFLIDWGQEGPHPCDTLPDHGVELRELHLFHPEPGRVNPLLAALGAQQKAARGTTPKIEAVFHGRLGRCVLT